MISQKNPVENWQVRIVGTVQGVGFRPFVYRLARELGIGGRVGNDGDGVWCVAEGDPATLEAFVKRVQSDAPPLARIDSVRAERAEISSLSFDSTFTIEASFAGSAGAVAIPPDVAACSHCLREFGDPDDRRFQYTFTCCTDCGPRFTVVEELPYDRERTSMGDFPLCEPCRAEYTDPDDRRFHAQATCCPTCGPTLELIVLGKGWQTQQLPGDPLKAALEMLSLGAIVAVKGIGGFQLICRADLSDSVQLLRDRKRREEKPFALLVQNASAAQALVNLDALAERALIGTEAPIVLAPARPDIEHAVAANVAPGTGMLGVMLPASPLHAALASGAPAPLVCTSGNHSGEPILTDQDDVVTSLGQVADAILTHNRRIVRRADDSIGQVVAGDFQLLRRARGFAPRTIRLATDGPTVLGVGAELKNTVCLAAGAGANVSVHLGDLENPATLAAFEEAIADQLSLIESAPQLVVHDLHPEYLSTKFAVAQSIAPSLGVQHHHAHMVSCLVDNGLVGPAIGVTFDGIGWGSDGTAWGGEFLVGDAAGFERAAHLLPVALPGGVAAIRSPWRMAVAHLVSTYGPGIPEMAVLEPHQTVLPAVVDLCGHPTTLATSSMGRLFDAVSALCGYAGDIAFEGQAAIQLEQLAARGTQRQPYPFSMSSGSPQIVDTRPLIRHVVEDLERGVDASDVALRFHATVAHMVATGCRQIRNRLGIGLVALSGGVFQNRLLVELVVAELEGSAFHVLRHRQVPANDGGISLGQVAIGRAHLS